MAADSCNIRNEKSSKKLKPYQQVAGRFQKWNRAIPEAGYITLGTIRYGIRLPADTRSLGHLPDERTARCNTNLITTTTPNSAAESEHRESSGSVSVCSNQTISSKNNDRHHNGVEIESGYDLCCCSGSAGLVAPCWKATSCCNKSTCADFAAHNRIESSSSSSSSSTSSTSSSSGRYTAHSNVLNATTSPQPISPSPSRLNISASILMKPTRNSNQYEMKMSTGGMGLSSYSRRSATPPSSSHPSRLRTPSSSSASASVKVPKAISRVDKASTAQSPPLLLSPDEGVVGIFDPTDTLSVQVSISTTNSASLRENGGCHSHRSTSNPNSVSVGPCCRELPSTSPPPLPLHSKIAVTTSTSAPSITNCCYTIATNSKTQQSQRHHHSNWQQNNGGTSAKRILESVDSEIVSRNFGLISAIPKPTKVAPPPVPPKPSNSNNAAQSSLSYDPANFRRKLEKFENQTRCLTNDRCELFGCFSLGSGHEEEPLDKDNSKVDNGRQQQQQRHLRYDSLGRLKGSSDPDVSTAEYHRVATAKTFPGPSPVIYTNVVIRKLTPKSTPNDATPPPPPPSLLASFHDDIRYIDAHSSDAISSSQSDCEILLKPFADTTNCNLSYDSVPKYLADANSSSPYFRSLSAKDVYTSLSDIDSFSEESINCVCISNNNNNENDENSVSCNSGSSSQDILINNNNNNIHYYVKKSNSSEFCCCQTNVRNRQSLENNNCKNFCCNSSGSNNCNNNNKIVLSASGSAARAGLIHKRVPAIESFGYIQQRNQINDRDTFDKESMMEKRRNTLDRLQRLGFGRRSSPSPSGGGEKQRKSTEKSERLKELTELLRGNRSSPTPPPVPPPRRPRHGTASRTNSTEKPEKSNADSNYFGSVSVASNEDIILMDEGEASPPQSPLSERNSDSISPMANSDTPSLYQSLKPNTSVSCLESMMSKRDLRDISKSPPPLSADEAEDIQTSLPRAEARTIIGSYTQRGIPFRSASFSQIDYSSGKYIKSTLSALRDRLRRDKSMEAPASSLPRKQEEFVKCKSPEPDFIYIPLKKTELNISLRYDNDVEQRLSLEEVVNPPDSIPEEEGGHSESDKMLTNRNDSNSSSKRNSDPELDETILPTTLGGEKTPPEMTTTETQPMTIPDSIIESNLATLMEEELPLESPPEAFLQTATTCLIPVPVYECTAQEWNTENPPPEWVDVAQDEVGIIPEILESRACDDEVRIMSELVPLATKDLDSLAQTDTLPTISVSHHSNQTSPGSSVSENDGFPESPSSSVGIPSSTLKSHEKGHSFDFSEVKKRYSNEGYENGEKSLSSDCILPRTGNGEEKRRIDKSKRRKGMYIESTDWVQPPIVGAAPAPAKGLELDISLVNFSHMKEEANSMMYLNSPPTDDSSRTPGSLYSFDACTPDSDVSRPPVWPKPNRSTLTCQSSEEKDDSPISSYPTSKAKQALMFLRTDSVSDSERDRTPPPSRDRTSPSPAPGDQDFKRYSKRPLRGPYGQMLEAEMKKPNKMYFEEILEELKDSESLSPRRNRDHSNRSFDDTHRHLPQHSNSMRVRKSNTYLPIPSHTRAASTPSQMENLTTTARLDSINPLEKRYQSSLDTSSTSSMHDKEFKKHSLGSHRDLSPKRAFSEIPTGRHSAKRSPSTVSEKPSKRHLDDMRLSQSSRTVSERSDTTESSGDRRANSGNLLATPELLAQLLKGSSEKLISEQRQQMYADTRTHVVQEIFRNEQSYVESLQTVVVKYFKVLKTPEHAGMIDSRTVDEIFFMVPDILEIHQKFLSEMKSRLDSWDAQQKVGDAFIETFSKTEVLETYTSFVNNCNRAKDAIRTTKQSRPSFARFLETTAREHKGKLSLDNLLIKPVQKFPNYEMLFTRLIKHTDLDHPDQRPLQEVLKLVHDILVHINCKEREILENGQREATLRELEGVIEGVSELVAADRTFLLFDLVSMPSGQGARKERGFFLFNDLLVITSIKRRSGTIRKPNTTTCPGSVASTLDTNKYKFLTKVSLDNLDIVKTKDENLRRIMNEIEQLADDCNKLQQIAEITATVKTPHPMLEDTVRDLQREVQRQLYERQSNDAQINMVELSVNSPNGTQKLTIVFNKAEKRSQWEESFNEAKLKLAASLERHPIPEFMTSIPIRKTRAGLQFTCAAPTLSEQKDVWVCNSDGYVGQVCVMSLSPEPNVTSCNGVCNARILCVASVPAYSEDNKEEPRNSLSDESVREFRKSNSPNCHLTANPSDKKPPNSGSSDIQLDSNSSSDDSEPEAGNHHRERIPSPAPAAAVARVTTHHQNQDSNSDETDGKQSTMWLGTEDGCIHVYNCTDNIRIKKNKIKIQHVSAVYSILYLDNRVFVSLANGDICVYLRDNVGWNTNSPLCISIGTVSSPVNKLLNVHGKLWCSIQGIIKVLDTKTLQVEHQIQISSDSKPITNMAVSNNYVWISIQNSAHIKCFHSNNHELIFEVNLAPSVNKMLSNCDDIIRQHKAACLRVTSLLSCKDLIWIGTSAGVLLTIPAQGYGKGTPNLPVVTGIPHGHTGHVRFLTFVETGIAGNPPPPAAPSEEVEVKSKSSRSSTHAKTTSEPNSNILIISGGDGYEDFRNSGANSLSEIAGREDSTNHLLIWQI